MQSLYVKYPPEIPQVSFLSRYLLGLLSLVFSPLPIIWKFLLNFPSSLFPTIAQTPHIPPLITYLALHPLLSLQTPTHPTVHFTPNPANQSIEDTSLLVILTRKLINKHITRFNLKIEPGARM